MAIDDFTPVVADDARLTVECLVPNGLKKSDIEPLNRLLIEFSPRAKPLTFTEWHDMTITNFLFVVRTNEGTLVGMATLLINRIPTGTIGLVEDVVVTEKYQGKGAGKKLMQYLIQVAKERNLKQLDLTSRRSRTEANRLYQKLGFDYRETNNYRLTL